MSRADPGSNGGELNAVRNADEQPRCTVESRAGAAWVTPLGRWSAGELGQRQAWRTLQQELKGTSAAMNWELSRLQWLDHVGAQVLWKHWGQRWPAQLQASASQKAMLQRVSELSGTPEPQAPGWSLLTQVDHLGRLVINASQHCIGLLTLLGQLLLDVLRLIAKPRRGPWRDISGNVYSMGATALPITALVGFLIGVVLAYLMALQLRRFGAETFIVDILGISLIRELGPLLAAILVAGRSGSSITAQIGVMRVTEELDAMQVMGISKGYRLVMPRAIALAIAMPLVALWTILASLAGGMLASDMALGITPSYFLQDLPASVNASNLTLAMAKSMVFGVLIALIGCHWGLRVEPNTQSLGQGTTASVVSSIAMVIVVDAIFAILFKNVGF